MRVACHLDSLGCASRQGTKPASHNYGWFDATSVNHLSRTTNFDVPDRRVPPKITVWRHSISAAVVGGRSGGRSYSSANLLFHKSLQYYKCGRVAHRDFSTQPIHGGPSPPRLLSRASPSRPISPVGVRPTRSHRPTTKADDVDDELLAVSSEAIQQEIEAKTIEEKHQAQVAKLAAQQEELARQEVLRQKQAQEEERLQQIQDRKRRMREQEARIAAEKKRKWEQYLSDVWTIHYREYIEPVQKSVQVLEENHEVIYRDLWQRRLRPVVDKINSFVGTTTQIHRQIYPLLIRARRARRTRELFKASVPIRAESALAVIEDLKANTGRHMAILFATKQLYRIMEALTKSLADLFQILPRSRFRLFIVLLRLDLKLFMRNWDYQAHEYRRIHRLTWVDTIYPGMFDFEILANNLNSSGAALQMLDDEISTLLKQLRFLHSADRRPLPRTFTLPYTYMLEINHHLARVAPAGFYLGEQGGKDKSHAQFFYNMYPLGSYLVHFSKFNHEVDNLEKLMRPQIRDRLQEVRKSTFKESRSFSRIWRHFLTYHRARFDLQKVDQVVLTQTCRRMIREQYLQLVAQNDVLQEYKLDPAAHQVAHERVLAVMGDGKYYPELPSPSIPVHFITSERTARVRFAWLTSGTIAGIHLHLPDKATVGSSQFACLVVATLERVSVFVLDKYLDFTKSRLDQPRVSFRKFWQGHTCPNLKIVSGFDEARKMLEALHILPHNMVELPIQEDLPSSPDLARLGLERADSLSAICHKLNCDSDLTWVNQLIYKALHNLYTFLGVGRAQHQHDMSVIVRRLVEQDRDEYRRMFAHNTRQPTLGPVSLELARNADLPCLTQDLALHAKDGREDTALSSRLAEKLARDAVRDGLAGREEHDRICRAATHYYKFTTFARKKFCVGSKASKVLWLVDRFKLRLNDEDRQALVRQVEQCKESRPSYQHQSSVQEDPAEAVEEDDSQLDIEDQQIETAEAIDEPALFSPFGGPSDDILEHADDGLPADVPTIHERSTPQLLRSQALAQPTEGEQPQGPVVSTTESSSTEWTPLSPLKTLARRVAGLRRG